MLFCFLFVFALALFVFLGLVFLAAESKLEYKFSSESKLQDDICRSLLMLSSL